MNESALTGESLPVDKAENDKVSAGTINQSGFLRCRATGVGEDTALSQIIRMVSDAAATKAPIAKTADKVAGVFVPTVIGIAAVTIIVWLLVGQTFGYALARGISVLVISCRARSGLPRRSPLWSAAASARKTAFSSKRRPRLKRPAAHRSLCSIRPAPSRPASRRSPIFSRRTAFPRTSFCALPRRSRARANTPSPAPF